MKVISIFLIILFAVILSAIEIPKMFRSKLYKELTLFIVFLIAGVVNGLLLSLDVKISNPSDWVSFIFLPFGGLMKYIMK